MKLTQRTYFFIVALLTLAGSLMLALPTLVRADGPTAIELIYFIADGGDSEIFLDWETGSELDTAGYRIKRIATGSPPTQAEWNALDDFLEVEDEDGDLTDFLFSQSISGEGAEYEVIDIDVITGQQYYYLLIEFTNDGGVSPLWNDVTTTWALDETPTPTPPALATATPATQNTPVPQLSPTVTPTPLPTNTPNSGGGNSGGNATPTTAPSATPTDPAPLPTATNEPSGGSGGSTGDVNPPGPTATQFVFPTAESANESEEIAQVDPTSEAYPRPEIVATATPEGYDGGVITVETTATAYPEPAGDTTTEDTGGTVGDDAYTGGIGENAGGDAESEPTGIDSPATTPTQDSQTLLLWIGFSGACSSSVWASSAVSCSLRASAIRGKAG